MRVRVSKKRAKGHRDGEGDRKIAVRLTDDMFDRLAAEAEARGVPMVMVIREYLYAGMYGRGAPAKRRSDEDVGVRRGM